MKGIYEQTFTVRSWEAGPDWHAGAPTLLRFMQEAAVQNVQALGAGFEALRRRGLHWFALRMSLRVARLPAWEETVCVRTWPSARDRLFFHRRFHLSDAEGRLLAEAASAWILVEAETRKNLRADTADVPVPDVEAPYGPGFNPASLPRLRDPEPLGWIRAGYRDLDVVGHVNNVRYVEWVLDSLPCGFVAAHRIASLDVNYLAESGCGDLLGYCVEADGGLRREHVIQHEDGRPACRARTEWVSKDD